MNPEDPQSQPPQQPPQPPPGYVPPAGYPPQPGYGAQQPMPPGYAPPPGYPPPGYAPPGYPPPGYGPQGYYMPPPVYVPPAVYHVPAADGRPPQMVPAASGSLWQAWLSVATRPSRQNFAAWGQITTGNWVRNSIIVAAVLEIILATGIVLFVRNILQTVQTSIASTNATAAQTIQSVMNLSFLLIAVVGVVYVVEVFAIPFGQALFISSGLGTVRQRFVRALKPWALAQVGLAAVGLVYMLIILVLAQLIVMPGLQTLLASDGGQSAAQSFFRTYSSFSSLLDLVAIPFTVYQYMMQIQSGAVGASMNRWAIFGINLLTNFVLGMLLSLLIFLPLILLIFRSVAAAS